MSSVDIASNPSVAWLWPPLTRSTWLFPSFLSAVAGLMSLGSRPLDGHEVLVAQTAREMLRSGDWIRPTFNAEARLQKPPLAYWMVAGASRLTNVEVSPALARLPSALSAILLTAGTALLAGHMFGRSVGQCAGCFQAMSVWSVMGGRSALVDMPLALFVFLAITMSTEIPLVKRTSAKAKALLFWMLLGLTVLAKGPVGLIFVIPTVVAYRTHHYYFSRERFGQKFIRSAWHVPGFLLFLAMTGWWPTMIFMVEPAALDVWYDQSLGRFMSRWGEQTRPWYYYFYQVPWLTFPSSLFLCWGWAIRGNKIARPLRPEFVLVLVWFLVPFVMLGLSQGKRDHYILPALPPISILAGLVCSHRFSSLDEMRVTGRAIFGTMLSIWVVTVVLFLPKLDAGAEWQALIDRRRDELTRASSVIQWRCHDHSTRFMLDRPMIWTDASEALSDRGRLPGAMILTTAEGLLQVPAGIKLEIVDRSGFAPWARQHPKRELIIARFMSSD